MSNELIYQLSLPKVPYIGYVHAKILVFQFGSAEAVFKAKKSELGRIEGIGEIRANSIKGFKDFSRAEQEIAFIEKYKIKSLFLTDDDYPKRLLNCYDPPTVLFYKGNADLNSPRIVAVVGTRNNTEYGKHVTEKLIRELSTLNVLIVSGLAFGIDVLAHKAALKNKLLTVGALGHGLDTIYPPEHTNLAKDMIKNGGLLTEFPSNTKPDKHNFPSRNRLVAGMSDATIVVESGVKGGSLITADIANSYNRDVFAFPGKTTDNKSSGCNSLIRQNKAMLLTDAQEFIETMGWIETKKKSLQPQKELFVELTTEEKTIVDLLAKKETVAIDDLNIQSSLSSSAVASAILNLELKNVIESLPGKRYKLI